MASTLEADEGEVWCVTTYLELMGVFCCQVISGHLGWVRCIAVDPSNDWFATGSGDRTIKVCNNSLCLSHCATDFSQLWELATGRLKLTLTGHISTVRGLEVSPRQPYLFSCGEDKTVKCWDLEMNKVHTHTHTHISVS